MNCCTICVQDKVFMYYVQKILHSNTNKRCRGWLKKVNDSDRCTHSLALRHEQLIRKPEVERLRRKESELFRKVHLRRSEADRCEARLPRNPTDTEYQNSMTIEGRQKNSRIER